MKTWRLSRKRSTAKRAHRALHQEWVDGWLAYLRFRVQLWSRRAPYLSLPLLVGVLVLVPPFVASVGAQSPSWLDTAWQVTGVLIGFALAMFVFLMQASVDRSLRSRATFRAIIRSAGVEWPLGVGLTLVAYPAAADRWGGKSALPAWGETWLLAVFICEVLLFAVVFGRGIRLLPPVALFGLIRRSFGIAAREATHRQLERRIGMNLLQQACDDANADQGTPDAIQFMGLGINGPELKPTDFGEIRVIDLAMPMRLAERHFAGRIGLMLAIGDRSHRPVRLDAPRHRAGVE